MIINLVIDLSFFVFLSVFVSVEIEIVIIFPTSVYDRCDGL